jgi:hypothetical protein
MLGYLRQRNAPFENVDRSHGPIVPRDYKFICLVADEVVALLKVSLGPLEGNTEIPARSRNGTSRSIRAAHHERTNTRFA